VARITLLIHFYVENGVFLHYWPFPPLKIVTLGEVAMGWIGAGKCPPSFRQTAFLNLMQTWKKVFQAWSWFPIGPLLTSHRNCLRSFSANIPQTPFAGIVYERVLCIMNGHCCDGCVYQLVSYVQRHRSWTRRRSTGWSPRPSWWSSSTRRLPRTATLPTTMWSLCPMNSRTAADRTTLRSTRYPVFILLSL